MPKFVGCKVTASGHPQTGVLANRGWQRITQILRVNKVVAWLRPFYLHFVLVDFLLLHKQFVLPPCESFKFGESSWFVGFPEKLSKTWLHETWSGQRWVRRQEIVCNLLNGLSLCGLSTKHCKSANLPWHYNIKLSCLDFCLFVFLSVQSVSKGRYIPIHRAARASKNGSRGNRPQSETSLTCSSWKSEQVSAWSRFQPAARWREGETRFQPLCALVHQPKTGSCRQEKNFWWSVIDFWNPSNKQKYFSSGRGTGS